MIKFGDLLKEAENIRVNNRLYSWDDLSIVEWVFTFYNDIIDNRLNYIAVNPKTGRFVSNSDDLLKEIEAIRDTSNEEKYQKFSLLIKSRELPRNYPSTIINPTIFINDKFLNATHKHFELKHIVAALRRSKNAREAVMMGRIFKIEDVYYISFWESNYDVKPHKLQIENMLNAFGISPYSTKWQFASFPLDEFIDFDVAFGADVEEPEDELSYVRRMRDMYRKQKLHAEKGILDKAIVQILQDKPEDAASLQAKLEDKFGMPLAAIKARFGDIPLDKLLARQMNELIQSFKKG